MMFTKAVSSLIGHQSPIVIPRIAQEKPEVARSLLCGWDLRKCELIVRVRACVCVRAPPG